MELKTIISVLENCHTELYYYCEEDKGKSNSFYAGARKELRRTINFMEYDLIQLEEETEL